MENDPETQAAQKELLEEAAAAIRAENAEKEARRPKNVGDGALGLVGDSLGGVALGAAAMVAGPVAGYREGGATGLLKGAVGGLCVGVASAAFGIGSGIVKLVDGASAQTADKNLPTIERNTTARSLEDDIAQYERAQAELYEGLLGDVEEESATLDAPVDTKLYEVLGVEHTATPKEIRRAYFRLAQQAHPDKNLNDPTATEKFQKISEAYQVLSDPVKREQYHRMGQSNESEGFLDPKSLFALMFGNDKFEHIVGDLATSTLLNGERGNPDVTPEAIEAVNERRRTFQADRVRKLAALLKRRLEPFINGESERFMDHARLEIAVLRNEPFAVDILHTAGYVYRKQGALVRGKSKGPLGLGGIFGELSDKAHMIRSKAEAIEGSMRAVHGVGNMNADETPEDAARRETVTVLGAVWRASVVDIQSTLRKVAKEVLSEAGVPKNVLRQRAEGLSILGKMFQQA